MTESHKRFKKSGYGERQPDRENETRDNESRQERKPDGENEKRGNESRQERNKEETWKDVVKWREREERQREP